MNETKRYRDVVVYDDHDELDEAYQQWNSEGDFDHYWCDLPHQSVTNHVVNMRKEEREARVL
jgi:hypothetical protein